VADVDQDPARRRDRTLVLGVGHCGAERAVRQEVVPDAGVGVGAADGAGREVVGGDPAGGGARERDTGGGQGEDEQEQSGGREARTASDQRASSEWPGAGFARGRLFEESTDSMWAECPEGVDRLNRLSAAPWLSGRGVFAFGLGPPLGSDGNAEF
jgi:hypothetical protein